MLDTPPTPIPSLPGCYIFRDERKRPLYVGKAKNLRTRVASYFRAKVPVKVERLRRAAWELEFIVTKSEWEAFLLENNLIKQFRPPFNTLLKDDKSYPYIKLTVKDRYPKALFTRKPRRDGALYFGPFVPGSLARKNLRILRDHFHVVTCRDPLNGSRPRPCLVYEMGHCCAPCVKGKVKPADYRLVAEEAKLFLEGKTSLLRRELGKRMEAAAGRREYETAAHYRDLIRAAGVLGAKQSVARQEMGRWDFFALYGAQGDYVLHSFVVLDGKVVDRRRWRFTEVELEAGELFGTALTRLYGNATIYPDGVAVSSSFGEMPLLARFLSERKGRKISVVMPRRGWKASLVRTLMENARLEYDAQVNPATVLGPMAKALDLPRLPRWIECFDVSHTSGEAAVASCVVWRGGRMARESYRRFKVKSVEGIDDYAAMAEVVGRRCARLAKEEGELPDFVLVDGGIGQANAAGRVLAEMLDEAPPVVGIAKREELLCMVGRKKPIVLEEGSPALRLLQQIRDEAHRFAVTYHRRKRSGNRLESRLLEVPGIGPVTAKKLLRAFMTTEAVRSASREELERVVGKRGADAVLGWADFVQ